MKHFILRTNLDCEVYIDTEFHGNATAKEDYNIALKHGAYWIECVSKKNLEDRHNFDLRTDEFTTNTIIEIDLKSICYNRIISLYDHISEFQNGFAKV